ncbi:hypothetical protein [Nocardia sp. NPDC057227]|uniref:hypothetical protein n=1 Tax=Nocardia sp. NPDC057227 TaxID=3346056 RepID=UPI003627F51B
MSDNNGTSRPLSNTLSAAQDGHMSIAMSAEDFIHVERDCEHFKAAIQDIQAIADQIARQPHWGLGENNDPMISARTVVDRFKAKANEAGDGNSVYEIMEQHYKIVEDIQEVHRIVRQRMMDTDAEFAAEFQRLSTELEERPPVQPELGPYLLPDGSAR